MAHLYGDPEWSQKDLKGPISHAREHLAKSKLDAFSPERLASYKQELELRAKQGHPITFVDLWALVLEFMLHGQVGTLHALDSTSVHLQGWSNGGPFLRDVGANFLGQVIQLLATQWKFLDLPRARDPLVSIK